MEVNDALYGLKKLALKDPAVREALLATRLADNPLKEYQRGRRRLCRYAAEYERRRGEFSDAALRRRLL